MAWHKYLFLALVYVVSEVSGGMEMVLCSQGSFRNPASFHIVASPFLRASESTVGYSACYQQREEKSTGHHRAWKWSKYLPSFHGHFCEWVWKEYLRYGTRRKRNWSWCTQSIPVKDKNSVLMLLSAERKPFTRHPQPLPRVRQNTITIIIISIINIISLVPWFIELPYNQVLPSPPITWTSPGQSN